MRLLFINDHPFPYGDAFSSRARSLCLLFKEAGFQVHVIAVRTKDEQIEINKVYELDGFTYEIASKKKMTSAESFFGNRDMKYAIMHYLEENQVDMVFSSACPNYYRNISKVCKKKGIIYIVEQCEWLDISNYKFSYIDYRYLNEKWIREGGYKGASGVIAISRLLQEYYENKGTRAIRIPTILDTNTIDWSTKTTNEKINIVYTGNPGVSKEYLLPIIQAIVTSDKLKKKVVFHIYGPSLENVKQNIGRDLEYLLLDNNDCIVIHGRVPQEEIHGIIQMADYQIFIRLNRRSSNAGFPTKMGESMACGTPVITNITGDIGLYLEDGLNGFVVNGIDKDSVTEALVKACELSKEQYGKMRMNARRTAEKEFNYQSYIQKVKTFFSSL